MPMFTCAETPATSSLTGRSRAWPIDRVSCLVPVEKPLRVDLQIVSAGAQVREAKTAFVIAGGCEMLICLEMRGGYACAVH